MGIHRIRKNHQQVSEALNELRRSVFMRIYQVPTFRKSNLSSLVPLQGLPSECGSADGVVGNVS